MKKIFAAAVFLAAFTLGTTGCAASATNGDISSEMTVGNETATIIESEGTSTEVVNDTESAVSENEVSAETVATEVAAVETLVPKRDMPELSWELDDNIFWDSLVYTGYNIEKHIDDGLMWHYVLAANKRGKGWLSDITYAGGSTGYETTDEGLPDISFFEDHGLVCASYVSYVYFNYLPNVAGVDTSELTMPERSYSANDWYTAAKDWVEQGYSRTISFEASLTPAGFIQFTPEEEIPVGSIIAFCDARNKSDYCSHVVIYAGHENDYNWVYHVGNENGPEFCSVERMHFGPDPQWPICVITTPDYIIGEE